MTVPELRMRLRTSSRFSSRSESWSFARLSDIMQPIGTKGKAWYTKKVTVGYIMTRMCRQVGEGFEPHRTWSRRHRFMRLSFQGEGVFRLR